MLNNYAGGGWNERGRLEVCASYPPITIGAKIFINITENNYLLEYCFMYISVFT